MFLDSAQTDAVVSIGGTQFTGKNVIVTELKIKEDNYFDGIYDDFGEIKTTSGSVVSSIETAGTVTIDIQLKCSTQDLTILQNLFDGKTVNKIRYKKVEDCSIEELLFAIRQKSKS